jgi:O-antigen ligase
MAEKFYPQNRMSEQGFRVNQSPLQALQLRLTSAVLLSSMIGYPLVSLFGELFGVASNTLSVSFRIFVIVISIALMIANLLYRSKTVIYFPLAIFLGLYLLRLLFDLSTNQRIDVSTPLQIFIATAIVPAVAISLSPTIEMDWRRFNRFLLLLCGLGLLLVVVLEQMGLAFNPWEAYGIDARLQFYRLNPISLGLFAGVGFLSAVWMLYSGRETKLWKFISLVVIVFAVYVLLASSSRGAWLGVILALFSILLRKPMLAVAVISIVALALLTIDLPTDSFDIFAKVQIMLTGGLEFDQSINERLLLQRLAIEDFMSSPIVGHATFVEGTNEGEYPHNIIIETAMALGVIGLIPLCISLSKLSVVIFGAARHSVGLLGLLLIPQIVIATTTGALYGHGALYVVAIIVLPLAAASRSAASAMEINSRDMQQTRRLRHRGTVPFGGGARF